MAEGIADDMLGAARGSTPNATLRMQRGVRGDHSREAPLMRRMLSEMAEEISVGIARRLTDNAVGLHRVMMLLDHG